MDITSNNAAYLNASSAYNKLSSAIASQMQGETSAANTLVNFDNILNQISSIPDLSNKIAASASGNGGLIELATSALNKARDKLRQSEYVSGKALVKEASLTDMVTALSEAEIALQSVISIRDKVIAAYQDIIKMQM
jgi:flagellar hook-basal body complex protein FliE